VQANPALFDGLQIFSGTLIRVMARQVLNAVYPIVNAAHATDPAVLHALEGVAFFAAG